MPQILRLWSTERKRLWPTEAYSGSGVMLNKTPGRNHNFGLENAFIYAIWNVKEI